MAPAETRYELLQFDNREWRLCHSSESYSLIKNFYDSYVDLYRHSSFRIMKTETQIIIERNSHEPL